MMMLVIHYHSILFFLPFFSSSFYVSICMHIQLKVFMWPAASTISQPINNKQRRFLPVFFFFYYVCVKQKDCCFVKIRQLDDGDSWDCYFLATTLCLFLFLSMLFRVCVCVRVWMGVKYIHSFSYFQCSLSCSCMIDTDKTKKRKINRPDFSFLFVFLHLYFVFFFFFCSICIPYNTQIENYSRLIKKELSHNEVELLRI